MCQMLDNYLPVSGKVLIELIKSQLMTNVKVAKAKNFLKCNTIFKRCLYKIKYITTIFVYIENSLEAVS